MFLQVDFLANHSDKIPQVAQWLHDEWGYLRLNSSIEKRITELQNQVNKILPPIHIIAVKGDLPIGVAALKPREMAQFPAREFWLGVCRI